MSDPISVSDLQNFLRSSAWKTLLEPEADLLARKLSSSGRVSGVSMETLAAGDLEIRGHVHDLDGSPCEVSLAIWREGADYQWEGSCSERDGEHCPHAAAILTYLAKHRDRVTRAAGQTVASASEDQVTPLPAMPQTEEAGETENTTEPAPQFRLRVERRPAGERHAWMPEIYATAWVVYGDEQWALSPSGHVLPVPGQAQASPRKRSRVEESGALQLLYALDLHPQDPVPPPSLKKLLPPPVHAPLWSPLKKKWPDPSRYWQRFHHAGIPALEKRGWQVSLAPEAAVRPLVFRTEGWKAEIVEEGRGWFQLSAGFEIDGESFELQPILAALLKHHFLEQTADMPPGQEFMIFLPDGRGLALPVGRFRHILQTLGRLLQFPGPGGGANLRLNALDAAQLLGDWEEQDIPLSPTPDLARLATGLPLRSRPETSPLPAGIEATLRHYQHEGFSWMQFLAGNGLHGILADDMGLGKTLQTLTHLVAEKESGRSSGKPSLVLAPTSVVYNWEREAAKFAPGLSVLVLQGPQRKRKAKRIPHADLVLSSYALLPRDLDWIGGHAYHLLILDEAQHIKNEQTQIARAVREVSATHRLCLSGTPVENHLGELWALMDFLMPGFLGQREAFRTYYQNPIERGGNQNRNDELSRRLAPLILRRTKHDVAKELPPKTEILHEIEMDRAQKDLYETVRSTMDKKVREALAMRGQEASMLFLSALLQLRQICCHPRLVDPGHGAMQSAKFDYLVDLLDTLLAEGHRVLLFSQFTSMLDLIEAHLQDRGTSYLKLTGATRDRQSLVERFQSGEAEVFLISLKAGGTGLTLTGADTVIHYDPWWNPAAENQATDRAYRIGQDKAVMVHKLICRNTVEERIQQMQEKKGGLAEGLLSGALPSLTLSEDSLDMLLGWSPENG